MKCILFVPKIFAIFRLRHAHVRKDNRLSLLFRTASDEKLGGAWERGYSILELIDCFRMCIIQVEKTAENRTVLVSCICVIKKNGMLYCLVAIVELNNCVPHDLNTVSKHQSIFNVYTETVIWKWDTHLEGR